MNDELKKCLEKDERKIGIREEDVELINKYMDDDILFIYLNKNKPIFTEDDKKKFVGNIDPYSDLDELNRSRVAFTCIVGKELNSVGNSKFKSRLKPTGWKSIGCDYIVDGKCLYNRCHLIGCQLAADKADKRGLITGTRNFNVNGMLIFEDKVANHIKNYPEHHILYRVTPYYGENNLLAYGVQMEMLDLDDEEKHSLNVFVFNKQAGFTIDYRNGEAYSDCPMSLSGKKLGSNVYVLDKNTKKFHKNEHCTDIGNSKAYFVGKGKSLIEKGYCICEICIS